MKRTSQNLGRFSVLVLSLTLLSAGVFTGCSTEDDDSGETSTQTEAPKAEAAKPETAKTEAPKAETPKTETAAPEKAAKSETPEKERKPASAAGSEFVVHLGAFREEENAKSFFNKMKADGYPVQIEEMNHSVNGDLFLVHLEPTQDREKAQEWTKQLKEKSSVSARLVVRPAQ